MQINEIVVREFEYELENIGKSEGDWVYEPGAVQHQPGFVLTIRTEDGLEGHCRGHMFTPPMVAQIRMVAEEHLIGRDPLEREAIWQDLWRALRHTDHLGLGPIDIALWDLAGKHYGESVSGLLGGFRDSVDAYASTLFVDEEDDGLNGPSAFAEYARQCSDRGYGGFKFHGHPEGLPETDVAICEALDAAIGDEMDLMLDASSLYETYSDTLTVGRALDRLDFYWYEDPLIESGQSIQMASQLTDELDTKILGLEHVRTGPFGSVDHLAESAAELVRASAHLDGGITGLMKTAHAVEAFGLDVELLLGGPAHLHCMSAIRNTNYFEHGLLHPEATWLNDQGFAEPIEEVNSDGTIDIPEGPGLGVEIDWDFVQQHQLRRLEFQ